MSVDAQKLQVLVLIKSDRHSTLSGTIQLVYCTVLFNFLLPYAALVDTSRWKITRVVLLVVLLQLTFTVPKRKNFFSLQCKEMAYHS